MYVHASLQRRERHLFVCFVLTIALFLNSAGTLFAGTTGTINGTVTDSKTNLPLGGTKVNAVSSTGSYSATTDAKGFFAFTGVSPDTYTVSFELQGFQPNSITGVTVFADQAQNVSVKLDKSLATIGRVSARGAGGAFQPNQALDTYSVTSAQIQTQQGKTFALSETALLSTLPGVTIDSSGYPVLRGGRENEEGFQFEGIDYVDAFTSQFVNALALNGAGSLQLTPGGGDASSGNSGTGIINIVAKKGTYPAFGTLDFEASAAKFGHQFGAEYGFATPSGRISNYFSFIGSRVTSQYGQYGADSTPLNAYYGRSFEISNDLVDNFVYKFGHNSNQQVQLFYQTDNYDFYDNYGGLNGLYYKSNDPYWLANVQANLPGLYTTGQIQQIIGLYPGQTSPTQKLDQYSHTNEPNATFKIQYSNNLDASTFLTAKYYQVNATPVFSLPFDTVAFTGVDEPNILQGGQRNGFAIDLTKQLNSKNLIGVGGKFDFLHPVNSFADATLGFLATAGFGNALEALDFLPNTAPSATSAGCPNLTPSSALYGSGITCGYLAQYFPGGVPRIPAFDQSSPANRQDFAAYLQDAYSPTNRIKIVAGVRVDGTNYQIPSTASGLYDPTTYPAGSSIPSELKSPVVFEPKISAAWQITDNDAVRASFQRSVLFAPIADINSYVPANYYSAFNRIPSYDNTTGSPATFCGVNAATTCKSYGDQLYWEMQAQDGIPIQPARPETFSNYDFSYSHQFGHGVGMKITPFYRRGYNVLSLTQAPLLTATGQNRTDANGNVLFGPTTTTNLGTNTTTGIEFNLTKEAPFGFSGSFNATYINEFSNVPPLSSSEDFFPTIPAASLELGNLYRVGFLTPLQATAAVQYRTRSGLRINPIVRYNRGYPLGAGTLTAAFVNGVAQNVPQTNVTSPSGSPGATSYVCPSNPGTIAHPNICATRGFAESPSAGGFLSNAVFSTDLTVEFSPPLSHNTFGVQFTNLFNNLYDPSNLTLNGRYQPVAYGVPGPKTGTSTNPVNFPNEGFTQYNKAAFGQSPFVNFPNSAPINVRVYYQLGL